MFPIVIRAAAGPHDLGPGGHNNEELPKVEAQSDSDSDSDTVSSLWDEDGDDDRSSVTSINSESDIVIRNTTSVRLRCNFLPILITLYRMKGTISI